MITINYDNWGWAQWTLLFLEFSTLFGFALLHSKKRKDYHIATGVINFSVTAVLLIAGGFFS